MLGNLLGCHAESHQLHSILSRTRSHLVYECKHSITHLYGLNMLEQDDIAKRVKWLLEEDRFICREDGWEVDTHVTRRIIVVESQQLTTCQTRQRHFQAKQITELTFRKYFVGAKMSGNVDECFFDSINEVFICLVVSTMRHCLKAWQTGVFEQPPEFKCGTAQSKAQSDIESLLRNTNRARYIQEIPGHMGGTQPADAPAIVGYNQGRY